MAATVPPRRAELRAACDDGCMDHNESVTHAPGRSEEEPASDDLVLIQRMLDLRPEERLLGLVRAAEFFARARRV